MFCSFPGSLIGKTCAFICPCCRSKCVSSYNISACFYIIFMYRNNIFLMCNICLCRPRGSGSFIPRRINSVPRAPSKIRGCLFAGIHAFAHCLKRYSSITAAPNEFLAFLILLVKIISGHICPTGPCIWFKFTQNTRPY